MLLAGPSVALAQAEAAPTIKLSEPSNKGGLPMMEALWLRASVRAWSERELSTQDLSDLLWAANGINPPDKRRTAASAMNAQDVDIYAFTKAGVYLYDAANHALTLVVSEEQPIDVQHPARRPRSGRARWRGATGRHTTSAKEPSGGASAGRRRRRAPNPPGRRPGRDCLRRCS